MTTQMLKMAEISQTAVAVFEDWRDQGRQELNADDVVSLIDDVRLALKTNDYSVLPAGLQHARHVALDAQVRGTTLRVKVETMINASK